MYYDNEILVLSKALEDTNSIKNKYTKIKKQIQNILNAIMGGIINNVLKEKFMNYSNLSGTYILI